VWEAGKTMRNLVNTCQPERFRDEYRTHIIKRGVVVSVVRPINEVTLRRARLVLGWVTVFGRVYHHGM